MVGFVFIPITLASGGLTHFYKAGVKLAISKVGARGGIGSFLSDSPHHPYSLFQVIMKL
jgi:hypothetical protein